MRDPVNEMQKQAARLLPPQPGVIIPGWFWQEWMLAGGGAAVVVIGIILALVN
jgi:hypothetical protein